MERLHLMTAQLKSDEFAEQIGISCSRVDVVGSRAHFGMFGIMIWLRKQAGDKTNIAFNAWQLPISRFHVTFSWFRLIKLPHCPASPAPTLNQWALANGMLYTLNLDFTVLNFNITRSTAESCCLSEQCTPTDAPPPRHGFVGIEKHWNFPLSGVQTCSLGFSFALWGEQHNYRDNNIKLLVSKRVRGWNSWSHFKHPPSEPHYFHARMNFSSLWITCTSFRLVPHVKATRTIFCRTGDEGMMSLSSFHRLMWIMLLRDGSRSNPYAPNVSSSLKWNFINFQSLTATMC